MAVYFLSDLHLGAPYFPDSRVAEKRVVSFLNEIKGDAEAVFLLGDILDYWYEYRYVVPRGFVRFFGKLAELADAGIRIVWMKGNHDIWIFDYLTSELGIEVADGSLVEELYGKKYFLAHGDGVGCQSRSFRFLRSLFRNRVCQKAFSAIHPRWTVPFAYNWSRHSRMEGEARGIPDRRLTEGLLSFSKAYLAEHPDISAFVYGHVHVFTEDEISPGCKMYVLGEWIHTYSYLRLTESGIEMKRFVNK